MTQSSKISLIVCGLLVAAVLAREATAATRVNTFTVTADVVANCTVSTDSGRLAAEYRTLDAAPGAGASARSVAVRCTMGMDPEISVARVTTETELRGARRTVIATVMF